MEFSQRLIHIQQTFDNVLKIHKQVLKNKTIVEFLITEHPTADDSDNTLGVNDLLSINPVRLNMRQNVPLNSWSTQQDMKSHSNFLAKWRYGTVWINIHTDFFNVKQFEKSFASQVWSRFPTSNLKTVMEFLVFYDFYVMQHWRRDFNIE